MRHALAGMAVVVLSTAGCMATYRVSPSEYVSQHNPAQILIMDKAGAIYLMDGPQMKGDTLVGIESGTPDSLVVPVAHVEDALVKHSSKGKTVALVAGLTAGVGMAAFAVITQGSHNPCRPAANKTPSGRSDPGGTSQCDTSGEGPIENPY